MEASTIEQLYRTSVCMCVGQIGQFRFVLYEENKTVVNIFILKVFFTQKSDTEATFAILSLPRGTRMVYPTWNIGGDFEYTKNVTSNFLEFFESLLYALWFFTHFASPENATKWQEYLFWLFLCEKGGNALCKCGVALKSIFACLDPFSWRNSLIYWFFLTLTRVKIFYIR